MNMDESRSNSYAIFILLINEEIRLPGYLVHRQILSIRTSGIFVHTEQEGGLTSVLETTILEVVAVLVAVVTMTLTWLNREAFS